jgi:hypothetical protein
VLGPGEAARKLRDAGGPDPLACGTDPACLGQAGSRLGAQWVVAVGIGAFGDIFDFELSALELRTESRPSTTTATWAAPGPNWERAIGDALATVLPATLLQPAATLVLVSEVEGAQVLVDGEPVGTTPMAQPLRLQPGTHELQVSREGYMTQRRTLELGPGRSETVELALIPMADRQEQLRTWSYVAGGAAAAALVGAVLLHVGAASAMDDAQGLKDAGKPFADRRETALSRRGAATGLYVGAGAAAAGAAVLFLLGSEPGPATR